ncbi:MAG: LPS export ABC transporter periplasmic protein LptC [Saprospiraceae bacterium]|nr:LPS export ABC transporter periplasmic protein LptC [Saprospiraceae bacterium]
MNPLHFRFKILISIVVISCTAMLFSCENEIEDINSLYDFTNNPVDIAKEVEIAYSDSGKIRMLLKSPIMEKYDGEDPYTEMPKGVKVFFYDSVKTINSYLTANYAINREKSQIMEAKNDVVVINAKGERLNTEHLIWEQRTHLIHTNKGVKITTTDEVIFGKGLKSDETFDNWEILNVTGSFTITQDEDEDENKNEE